MPISHILGFPRIGAQRELKFALESFLRGESNENELRDVAKELRQRHWELQKDAGLDFVSVGDFSYYDQMLGMSALLGALPSRFGFEPSALSLSQFFELARGNASQPAMEMTKWFDTNYHYLVPELSPETTFDQGVEWLFDEVAEAIAMGFSVKPVLIGPLSYLYLAKSHHEGFDRLSLLPELSVAYRRILKKLADLGVTWVQLDEPALAMDLDEAWLSGYQSLPDLRSGGVKLLLTTYFEDVSDKRSTIVNMPVDGLHIDWVRASQQLEAWRQGLPKQWVLSLGVIDGRNIWRSNLSGIKESIAPLASELGARLWVASSCSLLHVPVTLACETRLSDEIHSWLAFASEKLLEIRHLALALGGKEQESRPFFEAADRALEQRRVSPRVINALVQRNYAAINSKMTERASDFATRVKRQRAELKLPLLPTTTIGSFPQTKAIREARAAYKRKELTALDYLERMREEIHHAVRRQEELGLDVLVHGEAERNDMVEYFGEQLWGFAFTQHGWVQSYGSRCVKPPIIYGDVFRPSAMTVETTVYAQSLTDRPMKGMLTGPVTMLQWSFVRDDQSRLMTAMQLALAIRSEVADLEAAGIRVIQIDEPAFREGLPLRRSDWHAYLAWAVQAFRISAAVVKDTTQIHTHMCYSEFNDILDSIAAMDADVITIETSRSAMELLDGFARFEYPNEIGPGVYDIHSPRVPTQKDIESLLRRACAVIPVERLWVNPDCGLKTRGWTETDSALRHMVAAAKTLRDELTASTRYAVAEVNG